MDGCSNQFHSTQASSSIKMYQSIALSALFTTALLQQFAASQFVGTIAPIGSETDGLIMVTIQNNSTGNYSIEARNNLYDDANPYQPLKVKTQAGTLVTLVGSSYPYGQLVDSAFVTMSPGAVWQREFNMTEYIPTDPTVKIPTSKCFSISFPDALFAVNTTNFVADEHLATGFLGGASVETFIKSTPLHLNITVMPGTLLQAATATVTAEPVGTQQAATLVQGTAKPGLGGVTPPSGNSIDNYLSGVTSLFGPHKV